ncbi:beta-aspartyl-peptidase [Thermosipho atlanticus]|uniref:Isoaspartyl dipeptidase n=1 Tax=Thermosipho atlanticus DSM 15807 TaxID=1123380 RepID=A0A1M5TXC7_9BACT|nr:beta-aspartyl-peptidase [Thermosipho atlanticus]SHH55270.1 beta-aspartyl-dipeptidase (metallo-type) [Thermosipho atlanticus DSM 15807]
MIKLLKNGIVYTPKYLGRRDILILGEKIGLVEKEINIATFPLEIETYDLTGKTVVPGFIDSHVHLTGGGGEGGYSTRTPEINLSQLIEGGITTVIGCLGTDGITRSLENLYAKAKALDEEGITTLIFTGSYAVPPVTFTGSIVKDIVLIDKVVGVGEIAISDHRSTQPTLEEIKKIASNARLGGLLSGKAGIVNFHVGAGERGIDYLFEIVLKSEIPITNLYPTHMNRNEKLLFQGIEFAKMGGYFDLTTSTSTEEGKIKTVKFLKECYENRVIDKVTLTSDGQGSLPKFDEEGKFVGLKIGEVTSLFDIVKTSVEKSYLPLEEALKTITLNPSKVLKLKTKGKVERNFDADLVILDKDFEIDGVISRGNFLMYEKKLLKRGTFET